MLRVAHDRWHQTVDHLRALAVGAPHPRTRERFLALYRIAQGQSPAAWALESDRRHSTVLKWVHTYNESGPEALTYRRTGGWPPFLAKLQPSSAA